MSAIDQMLEGTSRKPRVHDANLPPAKLPKAAKTALEDHAKELGVSLSVVIRAALGEYMERRGIGA